MMRKATLLTYALLSITSTPCQAGRRGGSHARIPFDLRHLATDLANAGEWRLERTFQPKSKSPNNQEQKRALKAARKALNGQVTIEFDHFDFEGDSDERKQRENERGLREMRRATDFSRVRSSEEHSRDSGYGAEATSDVASAMPEKPAKCHFSTGEEGTWTIKNYGMPEPLPTGDDAVMKQKVLDEYEYERFQGMGPVLEIEVAEKKNDGGAVLHYSIPLRRVEFDKKKIRSASQGLIKWLPSATSKTSAIFGLAGFHTCSGSNIVDPRWAKGRKWYRSKNNGFRSSS